MFQDFFVPTFPGSMFTYSYWYPSHANLVQYDWEKGTIVNNITNFMMDDVNWGFFLINQSLYYLSDPYSTTLNMMNINKFISGNSIFPPQFTVTIPNTVTWHPVPFNNSQQLVIVGVDVDNDISCTKISLYQVADNTPPKLSSTWSCHDNETFGFGISYSSILVDVDPNTQVLVVYMTRSGTSHPVYIGEFSVSNGVVELKDLYELNDPRIYSEVLTGLYNVPLSARKNYPFDFVVVYFGEYNRDNGFYNVMQPIGLN
jgi:hypothetical protein